jgi:predicted nucleic acid-binding Zn ribbon protein
MPVYDYVCKDCRNAFQLALTLRYTIRAKSLSKVRKQER